MRPAGRAIRGSVFLAVAAIAAGVVSPGTLASGAAPSAAVAFGAAGAQHHRGHVRLMVVPARPRVGQHVRLYVTGVLRGGRYYTIVAGDFGNGGFAGGPSCAGPSTPTKSIYREPVTRHFGNRWSKAGTYRVSLTVGAPCTDPALPDRTVRGEVTVSSE